MTSFPLLEQWLPRNDDPARPLMTLSTAVPDARTVLLSEFDDEGLYFHTDSRSRKVGQLAHDPRVALTILFPARQLVVLGTAEIAPAVEQGRAYSARSPYLKQLAWQNTTEFAELPLERRRELWAAFAGDPRVQLPPETWIGYVVRPHRLTFWEGDPDAASRRTEFTLEDGMWEESYLPG